MPIVMVAPLLWLSVLFVDDNVNPSAIWDGYGKYGFEFHNKVHQWMDGTIASCSIYLTQNTATNATEIISKTNILFTTNVLAMLDPWGSVLRASGSNFHDVSVSKMSWINCIVWSHTKPTIYLFAYLIHLTSLTKHHLSFLQHTFLLKTEQWPNDFFPLSCLRLFRMKKKEEVVFRVIWNVINDAIAFSWLHTHIESKEE